MSATGQHSRPHPAWPPAPTWTASVRRSRRRRPGWGRHARWALLARWHGETLDRALAAGGRPDGGALIAARARQLTTEHSRRQLAGGLARVRVPRDAGGELGGLTAVVAPDRHEVAAAAGEIVALERRLRDGERVDPAGAAMLRLLLADGTSPLYSPAGAGSLARYLGSAATALEPPVR